MKDDVQKSLSRTQFIVQMIVAYARLYPGTTTECGMAQAAKTFREFITSENIEYGDKNYAWDAPAAEMLIHECEGVDATPDANEIGERQPVAWQPLPYSSPAELFAAFQSGVKFVLHYHGRTFDVACMEQRKFVVYVQPPGLPVKVFPNGSSAEGPGTAIWLAYASPQGPTEAEVNALEAIWLEINKATESPRSSDCVLALAIIKRRIGRIRSHRGRRNEAQSISQRLYQSRNCE